MKVIKLNALFTEEELANITVPEEQEGWIHAWVFLGNDKLPTLCELFPLEGKWLYSPAHVDAVNKKMYNKMLEENDDEPCTFEENSTQIFQWATKTEEIQWEGEEETFCDKCGEKVYLPDWQGDNICDYCKYYGEDE